MRTLLTAKAAVEAGAGLALVWSPSVLAFLLLGLPVITPADTVVARMAGAVLLAMGIACWLARNDSKGRLAIGLIVALLFYDAGVVVLLLVARLAVGLYGIILWPAVVLHSALACWSVLCLGKRLA